MPQQVIAAVVRKQDRVFVGKAWQNQSKNGLNYTNITFDRGLEVVIRDKANNQEYVISEGASIQGFPNTKREGKKDADLRLSFRIGEPGA